MEGRDRRSGARSARCEGDEPAAARPRHLSRAVGRHRRRREAGRDALALVPDAAPILNFLGYLLADHVLDLAEAERLVHRALVQDPDNRAYVDSWGWVLYRPGRLDEARVALERAVELTGGDPVVHEHLGDVCTRR